MIFVAVVLIVDGHAEVLTRGLDLAIALLLFDAYARDRREARGSVFISTTAPDYEDLGPVLQVRDGHWFVPGASRAQEIAA